MSCCMEKKSASCSGREAMKKDLGKSEPRFSSIRSIILLALLWILWDHIDFRPIWSGEECLIYAGEMNMRVCQGF